MCLLSFIHSQKERRKRKIKDSVTNLPGQAQLVVEVMAMVLQAFRVELSLRALELLHRAQGRLGLQLRRLLPGALLMVVIAEARGRVKQHLV